MGKEIRIIKKDNHMRSSDKNDPNLCFFLYLGSVASKVVTYSLLSACCSIVAESVYSREYNLLLVEDNRFV
jgi:hypothetical protein